MSGPLIWPLPPDQTTQEVDATNLRPGDIIVDAAGNTATVKVVEFANSWNAVTVTLRSSEAEWKHVLRLGVTVTIRR